MSVYKLLCWIVGARDPEATLPPTTPVYAEPPSDGTGDGTGCVIVGLLTVVGVLMFAIGFFVGQCC